MRERENTLKEEFMPIFHTIVFEIKKQRKKFYFFASITILIAFLVGYLLIQIPGNLLSDTFTQFVSGGLGFLSFLTLFSACLFFSGIICSEFYERTGFIVFPKINKYRLILGKYLGNLILVVSIVALYYFLLCLLGVLYYGPAITIRIFYSFGFAVLYVIMLSSLVTFFSSFMKNINLTIIVTLIILLIGFNIAESIITLIFRDAIEPLYSLSYLGNLITSILESDFPDPRYIERSFSGGGIGEFVIATWITPSIEMGITMFLIYIVVFFILAAYLFKRRQL